MTYPLTRHWGGTTPYVVVPAPIEAKDYVWMEETLKTYKGGVLQEGVTGVDRKTTPHIRQSGVQWLDPDQTWMWMYQRLSPFIARVNHEHFRFDLESMENFQYTEYTEGQNYDWHVDCMAGREHCRKLSMSILLSDPSEFEGGKFELMQYGSPDPSRIAYPELKKGDALFFPSFMGHRVTPVTSGVRHSVVCWVSGPQFK